MIFKGDLLQDIGPHATLMESIWSETRTPVTSWSSSLKGADTSAADGLLSFYSSVQLLASPHALETVLGDTTNTYLEELDYLCNLKGLQVLPRVTSSEKDPKISQEQ